MTGARSSQRGLVRFPILASPVSNGGPLAVTAPSPLWKWLAGDRWSAGRARCIDSSCRPRKTDAWFKK